MKDEEEILYAWQKRTDRVSAGVFDRYFLDGNTRRLSALRRLEDAFDKVRREVRGTTVGDVPDVWMLYNMGVVVKTREAVFSIDLHHRRAAELAPLLDFALITRARKTFRIRDVEVRTSYVDHNDYLVDFTTAFEVRVGKWTLYHTGDCGRGSEPKLRACRPDLWVFFPGCGIDVEAAVRRVRPKHLAFGHLWELGHKSGRLTAPLLRNALAAARRAGADPVLALWGDRLS